MADAPGPAGSRNEGPPEDPNEPGTGLTTLFEGDWATVRRLRKGKLVVVSGADQGKSVEIAKPRVTGGRSIISDLVVQDKAVSGTHFEVSARDDGYRLRDLNSRNGIFVGELRIREVFLRPGTVFRIGHTNIQFQTLEDVVEIELSKKDRFDAMLGASPAMREIFAHLEKVAPSDLTCLITGETGTGKEMVARALHNASGRKSKPFVVLDCGSIPRELIESTLFGHEKGSFTGAVGQHIGSFEQAQGGTIFLDEIGELPLNLQVKILRALQEKVVVRVGENRPESVDIRVLTATNRTLDDEIKHGRFREDLYYRLNVVNIHLPPLRDRGEDINVIAKYLLNRYAQEFGGMVKGYSPNATIAIRKFPWPGNIRQLENHIKKACVLADKALLGPEDLGLTADVLPAILPLADAKEKFQREYINQVLELNNGNRTKTARDLGVDPRTVFRHLEKEGDGEPPPDLV